ADDDRPRGAQLRHYRGVVVGPTTGGERRAALGRVIRRIDDVLDRDRNAMQRADRMAVRAALIEATRLRERMVTIEMRERLDLAVEPFNALETGAGIILRRNRAAGDFRCGLACSQFDELVGHCTLAGACVSRRRDSWGAKASSPAKDT